MNKIEALKKTIYNLENDVVYYNWRRMNSCNCGVVAKTLVGEFDSREEVFPLPSIQQFSSRDLFSDRTHCLMTNSPLPKVFSALRDAGFTDSEMKDLELLKSKEVLAKLGVLELVYTDKENLIAYLKAWVSILEESSQMLSSEPNDKPSVARKDASSNWLDKTKNFTSLIPIPDEVSDLTKEKTKTLK